MTSEHNLADELAVAEEFEGLAQAHKAMREIEEAGKYLLAANALRRVAALRASAEPSASVREVDYCTFGPPDERKRQWLMTFADADRGICIFDNEADAHAHWCRAKDSWTCTLYETCERKFHWAAGQLRALSPLMQAAGKAAETAAELTSDFAKALPGGTLDDSTYSAIEDALDAIDAPMTEGTRYMTLVERILALRAAAGKAAPQSSASMPMAHPRHNVYFMCQSCEEENPENAVCCREDIAVMPDGTWLCDNCYSDCEKTAYGMVASDIDDFEFPRFEDLPRPAPYIDGAARTPPHPSQIDAAAEPTRCPNGLEHGACLHPECVSSCPGRLSLRGEPAREGGEDVATLRPEREKDSK